MKNFISRIECVVEPSLYNNKEGESVQINVRCRAGDLEWNITKIEPKDFLMSNLDLVFDYLKEEIKHALLNKAKKEDLKPGGLFKIEELPRKLKYKEYVHNETDSNADKAHIFGLEDNEKFMSNFLYSLHEVEFDMEVDTKTGESWILRVNGVELKKPVKG